MNFFKNFFPLFFFFSFSLYAEKNRAPKDPFFFKDFFRKTSSVSAYQILTENKQLSRQLDKYFKKKSISKKKIQTFLFDQGYYKSKIIKNRNTYLIKNPFKIIFSVKGNSFFSEKEIYKIIKIDNKKVGTRFYSFVEAAIQDAYKREGFLKIKLKQKIVKQNWKEWIYLNISEGLRFRIAKLDIKGLLSKSNTEYENFIKNNSTHLIKRGFYSKKDLEIGYENLMNYLRGQGYLQSKIYSDRISFKGDKVFITINLEEGPLTLIRDIQIQNTQVLPVWEILSHIQSRVQAPLKIDLFQKDIERIENLYKSKGYINMKITNKTDLIQYTPGERYVSIVIKINEGLKAFVSDISIHGLKNAKEKMIRDLLKFKMGDIFTPLKKNQSIKALGSTGLFSDVQFNEKFVNDKLKVNVFLKERKKRSLRGGFGINSQRGFTTHAYSEITHRNLFGWGRAFVARGNGQVSFIQAKTFLEYELSGRYKEVFIPGYDYEGNISISLSKKVFNYARDNINFVRKNQISFFINKTISDHLKMRWDVFSFENRREDCTEITCPENIQTIGSTGFHTILDRRDNIFNPSKGSLSSLTAELSLPFLGSSADISFARIDFQNEIYWTLIDNYTIGFSFRLGMIHTIQTSQHLPVSRAFILGGQSSVRGYDGNIEGERIPSQKLAPIGTANEALRLQTENFTENVLKSRYGLINIDFRLPLFEGFKGLLFYDIGAVSLQGKKEEVLSYGHSIGVGFRYQTFLIPIGLDIAYKLPPKEGSDYRFHFSIGW